MLIDFLSVIYLFCFLLTKKLNNNYFEPKQILSQVNKIKHSANAHQNSGQQAGAIADKKSLKLAPNNGTLSVQFDNNCSIPFYEITHT